jgi:AcrR family transcriptional regulator
VRPVSATAGSRADRDALIAAAHQALLDGRRVEMRALATELGVGRTTLYRWAGDREQLLGEVLWRVRAGALEEAAGTVGGAGAARVAGIVEHHLRAVGAFAPLRQLLVAEPALALRVLIGARGGVQERTVRWFADVVHRERSAAPLAGEMDAGVLASALVRLGEGVLYTDVVAGVEPDVEAAMAAVRALLRG